MIDKNAILSALAKIISTKRFQRSRRSSALLSYVVNETLEGRSAQLKAFTIAQDVFGRDETFNPENDTLKRSAFYTTLHGAYFGRVGSTHHNRAFLGHAARGENSPFLQQHCDATGCYQSERIRGDRQ